MLIPVTAQTKIEDLVLLGAAVDGKITQQTAFIKKGLTIPVSFFFTSEIVVFKNGKLSVDPSIYDLVIRPNDGLQCEFQIRTESVNETDRASDFFSESRLGLSQDNLVENILGVVVDAGKIKKLVGLIQVLPPKSLERNIVAGLGQIIKRDDEERFYVSLHQGLATYLARSGTCDAVLDIPLSQIDSITNYQPYISYKSRAEIFQNIGLNLKRFGIAVLDKNFALLGLDSAMTLPWNPEKNRIKKEYEYSFDELSAPVQIPNQQLNTIIPKLQNDELVSFVVKELGIRLTEQIVFGDFLTLAGCYYLSQKGDEYNATKQEIIKLQQGNKISELISKSVFDLIVKEIVKLGSDILVTHLCSFSIVFNQITQAPYMIVWDMPLDKALHVRSDKTPPQHLSWISDTNFDFALITETTEDIGIDLEVTNTINSDLLFVLERLRQYKNVKNVYVNYSLLSHLATIIREHNFNVIAI